MSVLYIHIHVYIFTTLCHDPKQHCYLIQFQHHFAHFLFRLWYCFALHTITINPGQQQLQGLCFIGSTCAQVRSSQPHPIFFFLKTSHGSTLHPAADLTKWESFLRFSRLPAACLALQLNSKGLFFPLWQRKVLCWSKISLKAFSL